ncbi:MAG: hypothetical protein ACTSYI_02080 [Promethearchaeota archaeon]
MNKKLKNFLGGVCFLFVGFPLLMVIYLYYDQILRRLSESRMLVPLIILVSIGVEILIFLKKWIVRRPSKEDRKARRKARRDRKTGQEDKFQGEIPFEKHVK